MPTCRQKRDSEEERMTRSLDALAEFEDFRDALLPKLRRMVLENWSVEKIRHEIGPYMAARMAMIGLTGDLRSPTTLKAIKDTLDRHEGMAVQRLEQKTVYAKMSKAELAALAHQKLVDAGLIQREATGPADSPVNEASTDVPRLRRV